MYEVSDPVEPSRITITDSNEQKRIYLVKKEPKFARSLNNFWSKQTYYLYIILLGNTTFGMPLTFRFALDVSGGFYILELILFNFILILPIMYMETFLGKYVRMANSQMYRMAPIFFGFCVSLFLLSSLYCPLRITNISMFLIGSITFIKIPDELKQCPKGHNGGCFDLKDVSKDNVNCTYEYMGFVCGNKTVKRYVAAYIYWKDYKEIGGYYSIWPITVSIIITWICIVILCLLGMKVMGILLKITFIANFVIYIFILMLAVGTPGSYKGLVNMVQFKIGSGVNYSEMVMLAFFTTTRMGLMTPSGYMTYGAFTNYKSKLSPGTECIALSMSNILLNIYNLVVLHSVSGALGAILGLPPEMVYVPFAGLYYTMIPQFLVYTGCPAAFVIMYYLSHWLLDLVRLSLALYMLIMNLYDFFPALTKYGNYSIIVTGVISLPMSIIMSQETIAKHYLPIFIISSIQFLQGFTLILESIMVFFLYGVGKLNDDIHFLTGKRPIKYWRIMWYCYPIIIGLGLFLMALAKLQNKLKELPISKDLPVDLSSREKNVRTVSSLVSLLIIVTASFFYIVRAPKGSMTFMDLLKPQFYWGPQEKESRLARKAFAPRTSVRSQPPKKKKQRLRTRSIKQMHEVDAAERIMRGRVFLDSKVFTNVGQAQSKLSMEFRQRYESIPSSVN